MIAALLLRLVPFLVPALLGAIPAFAGGWFAHGVVFSAFERPAIIREAESACTIRTMDAANRAEQAERKRQQQINADVVRAYEEAFRVNEAQLAADTKGHEQAIAEYKKQIAAEGRSCGLSEGDLTFLGKE